MPRRPRPVVPEEHLGPVDQADLRRRKALAHCEQSPTGSHVFILTKKSDGTDDGPCQHCHKLHSKVHGSKEQNIKKEKRGNKKMANLVTVNDLAKETGCDARIIRRILRKSFNGGSKKTYGWEKGNPELKEIRLAIKNRGTKTEKPANTKGTDKAATDKKADKKPATKKTPKTTEKKETKKPATKKTGKATPKETETGTEDAAATAAIEAATTES